MESPEIASSVVVFREPACFGEGFSVSSVLLPSPWSREDMLLPLWATSFKSTAVSGEVSPILFVPSLFSIFSSEAGFI